MTQADIRPPGGRMGANWIRLRTMILLRWVAIAGQLIAVTFAPLIYGLQLEMGLCYLVIGASVIGNLVATLIFPENKRLSERENLAMILFDLLQLSLLLFLTGGLHNPFAMLVLGPVTISAAALSLRSTIVVGASAIVLVSLLAEVHLSLRTQTETTLEIPEIFIFGHWIALIIGVLFTSAYSRRVTSEIHSMADALAATQMALAREQKLTDLGGVVAAAAHELGTPLATIKLVSSELYSELTDHPDLQEDAALIREQTDRCRDILRDMGRAGKDDLHLRQAPLMAVIEEAAEPHMERGKSVHLRLNPTDGPERSQPTIRRMPEIIHGLRNLVQNAVDFADENIWIEARWNDQDLILRIIDDGMGFPPHMIGRIGDPFMRSRQHQPKENQRPEYEGMGLGLFIAKTLLERSGATLRFANGNEDGVHDDQKLGAIVEVRWPRDKIEVPRSTTFQGLGANAPIT